MQFRSRENPLWNLRRKSASAIKAHTRVRALAANACGGRASVHVKNASFAPSMHKSKPAAGTRISSARLWFGGKKGPVLRATNQDGRHNLPEVTLGGLRSLAPDSPRVFCMSREARVVVVCEEAWLVTFSNGPTRNSRWNCRSFSFSNGLRVSGAHYSSHIT